ncbi:trophoblast glycoprotein isoform X2 [Anabrus simplex]
MMKLVIIFVLCALALKSDCAKQAITKQDCENGLDIEVTCTRILRAGCLCGCAQYDLREPYWQFMVNCTDKGFTNTSILQQLPPQTEVLIFTGNTINDLPWNVFGTLNNYSNLRVVDMSNNDLHEIRGKSYHRVPNVELLILNHNYLSISDGEGQLNHHHPRIFSNFVNLKALHLTDAFEENTPEGLAEDLHDIFVKSNLTQLVKLHLEQNEIKGFKDPQIFCDLPNLMDLHLGDNELKRIDFNIECLPHLRFLDLERNSISSLGAAELQILDSYPAQNKSLEIDLDKNPFSCDCNIRDLYDWLQRTSVKVRNKNGLRCRSGMPETNGGETILGLQSIQCQPHLIAAAMESSQYHSIPILIGFLVTLLFVLLGLLVYMNRVQIKQQLTPLLDTVSRKVQYTSIGKQEDQEMDV